MVDSFDFATERTDPAAVVAEHEGRHECNRTEWDEWAVAEVSPKPDACLLYRLAEALAASKAQVAKSGNILDQYTDGKISKVACVSLVLNAADCEVSP